MRVVSEHGGEERRASHCVAEHDLLLVQSNLHKSAPLRQVLLLWLFLGNLSLSLSLFLSVQKFR